MAKAKVKMKYNIIKDVSELNSTNVLFENALKVNDKEYVVVLSAMELAKLYEDETIKYDINTQRGIKSKVNKVGEVTEEPIRSDKNIKDMIELIKTGTLCNSLITFNVPDDGKQHVNFDNGKLVINKEMTIIDGFHRISSCYTVMNYFKILKDDDLKHMLENTKFTVSIGNYVSDECKEIFAQLSKGLKLSKSKVESFDVKHASNRIVNKLNEYGVLKNKINTTATSIQKDSDYIYAFATVNEAIKNEFGVIRDEKEEQDIFDFLVLFFEEIFKIFPEFMDKELRQISKEYSILCENIFCYALMSIAELLYLKRFGDWRVELNNIEKIDFDKNNPIWQPIVRINEDKISLVNNKQTRNLLAKIIKQEFYKVQSL